MVCNYDPYTSSRAESIDLQLGRISNPYEVIRVAPVPSVGEGSQSQWIQTRGNPGKPISEMSINSLQSQEERARHFNALNAIVVGPGKPLDNGSLAPF